MTFDLWDLYRFDVADVFAGRRAPGWAWGLVERLVDEPWSRWRARQVGGDHWREHLGWSPDTYMAATLIDVQQVAVAVADAARVGKKPKLPEPLPRPKSKQDAAREDADLEDVLAAIARQIN